MNLSLISRNRFAIDDAAMEWGAAETRISSGKGTNTVISVKKAADASQKRKAEQEPEAAPKKKTRRSKAKK